MTLGAYHADHGNYLPDTAPLGLPFVWACVGPGVQMAGHAGKCGDGKVALVGAGFHFYTWHPRGDGALDSSSNGVQMHFQHF